MILSDLSDDAQSAIARWSLQGGDMSWRDSLDLSAHRAQVELKRMAEFARRSLGQRIRYARAEVRRVAKWTS